jgi:hypothetical protein
MPKCVITRQTSTYNPTFGRVRATIVAVEKPWVLHKLSVCICSLRYPASKAHAPYCHLWPAPLYNIFSHFLINGTIFEKKVTDTKCVFIFCTAFVWNISHSKKKRARYDKKMYIFLHAKYSLFLSDFNESWTSLTDFRIIHIKFHKNPPSGSWVVPCGRTDGHDAANSRFSQFCECA